jgi:hypothetical protein
VLALPFESVGPAHADIVRDDARARLAHALERLVPERCGARG